MSALELRGALYSWKTLTHVTMWQVNTVIFHRSKKQHNFLSLLAVSWGCQANNEALAISGGKGSVNAHLQDVCVSLASTSATHLNNSLIAAIMTAQLPRRGARGQEAAASVTIVLYPLATGTARPRPHQWCLERGCVGVTPQQLQVPYSHFSLLLQAAEDASHSFQLIPNTWFGFFFRCSCAPVTTCLVFPSSELNILYS